MSCSANLDRPQHIGQVSHEISSIGVGSSSLTFYTFAIFRHFCKAHDGLPRGGNPRPSLLLLRMHGRATLISRLIVDVVVNRSDIMADKTRTLTNLLSIVGCVRYIPRLFFVMFLLRRAQQSDDSVLRVSDGVNGCFTAS